MSPRRPLNLEVRDFRLLDALERGGSQTQASRLLNLTQPTLSYRVAELERRIDGRLLQRSGRAVRLTPLALVLLEAGRRVLRSVEALEEQVRAVAGGEAGTLRFAAECYTTYAWLPALLREFRAAHPNIEIAVVPEATADPIRALLDGDIEIALVTDGSDHPGLEVQRSFKDELVLVVAPEHPLADRTSVPVEALEDQHLLLYSSDPRRADAIRRLLVPAGVTPRRVTGIALTEGILALVRAGEGVTLMARWAVEGLQDRGEVRIVRLRAATARRTWRIVTSKGATPAAPLREFSTRLGEWMAHPEGRGSRSPERSTERRRRP